MGDCGERDAVLGLRGVSIGTGSKVGVGGKVHWRGLIEGSIMDGGFFLICV